MVRPLFSEEDLLAVPDTPWSVLRIFRSLVLVAIVAFVAPFFAVLIAWNVKWADRPEIHLGDAAARAAFAGISLTVSTWAIALVMVPLLRSMVAEETQPWQFLGFKRAGTRQVLAWCGAALLLIVVTAGLTRYVGDYSYVPHMLKAYATVSPVLFFTALVIAAPIGEELLFRGFLLGALDSRGTPVWISACLSSALWAALHVQYDLFLMGMIFFSGLLLAAARRKTGSIYPCIAMHALNNAVSFAETAYFATTGSP